MSYTSDGLDMGYVMDQGTKAAKWAEGMAGKQRHGDSWRESADNWRAMRWHRLDNEIKWAKVRRWTK